jgi:hypothetical protein
MSFCISVVGDTEGDAPDDLGGMLTDSAQLAMSIDR